MKCAQRIRIKETKQIEFDQGKHFSSFAPRPENNTNNATKRTRNRIDDVRRAHEQHLRTHRPSELPARNCKLRNRNSVVEITTTTTARRGNENLGQIERHVEIVVGERAADRAQSEQSQSTKRKGNNEAHKYLIVRCRRLSKNQQQQQQQPRTTAPVLFGIQDFKQR